MPRFNAQTQSGADDIAITGGIMGAIPGMNVFAPGMAAASAADREEQIRNEQIRLANAIETPTFKGAGGINYDYSGDFSPEMLSDPQLAQATLADDSPEGRAAQLAALRDMQGMANQAADSTYALGRQNAEMDARQLANSREGAIRQDAMRRGQLGGAADMISRQQAAQAAANQNLQGGMQSAQLQALQQLAGMQSSGVLGGQLRQQDVARNLANAGIQNQFSLYNTGNINRVNEANTGLTNAANMRNLDARQDVGNKNTQLDMDKLKRTDTNAMNTFNAGMARTGAQMGALGGQAQSNQAGIQNAQQAGQIGTQNFKDLMKMVGGG